MYIYTMLRKFQSSVHKVLKHTLNHTEISNFFYSAVAI